MWDQCCRTKTITNIFLVIEIKYKNYMKNLN